MRGSIALAGVIFAAVGFVAPLAWLPAALLLLVAGFMGPSGYRADGKRKTGGIFGGLVDNAAVNKTMRDCPHCLEKIPKEASRCKHCAGDVEPQASDNGKTQVVKTHIVTKTDGSPRKLYELANGIFTTSPSGGVKFESVESYKEYLDRDS